MTWYHQQVVTISKAIYPQEYLVDQVVGAKLFIDCHFAANLTLTAIAGEAHFYKYHFIRLFKSMYGQTPHQYLVSVRIEKAKQLLQAGAGIKDACFSVGFSSPTTFTGLFKKTTGCAPSALAPRRKPL